MSISLEKQTAKVKISLTKKNVTTAPVVRVGEALDISGSMEDNFNSGAVANILARTLAVANTFDDNGEMEMWAFNTHSHPLPLATPDNFESYVYDNIRSIGGGTRYSPVLRDIAEYYFPSEPVKPVVHKAGFFGKLMGKHDIVDPIDPASTLPAMVMFITDGENDPEDNARTEKLFASTKDKPIFWLLVGIGASHQFSALQNISTNYPNADFLNFADLSMSDEDLYDGIISQKFVDFIQQ